jgi:hypothetical protein
MHRQSECFASDLGQLPTISAMPATSYLSPAGQQRVTGWASLGRDFLRLNRPA